MGTGNGNREGVCENMSRNRRVGKGHFEFNKCVSEFDLLNSEIHPGCTNSEI